MAKTPMSRAGSMGFWQAFDDMFRDAKYIDLTYAFAPVQPAWPGDGPVRFMAGRAGRSMPGVVEAGEEFTYEKHGFVLTAYDMATDQYGTKLDPPAHWNPMGATISDLPATFALRPLAVIDIADRVAQDAGYHLQVADVAAWEEAHGRIPAGAVVMVRSDWHKRWRDVERFTQKPFPGVSLAALKFLHLERQVLFHGHEPLDTDMTDELEGERWLMQNNFTQAEGVAHLDLVPEAGALLSIGFAKPEGGTGGFARFIAIAPADWPHGVTLKDAPGAPLPTQRHPLKRDRFGVMRPTPPK
jgi:kynurenine formamidase